MENKTLCVFDCELGYGHLFGLFIVPYSTPDKVKYVGELYVCLNEVNGKHSCIDIDNIFEYIKFHRISGEEAKRLDELGLLNTGINPFNYFYMGDDDIRERFSVHYLANLEEEDKIQEDKYGEYELSGLDGFLTYLDILDYLNS